MPRNVTIVNYYGSQDDSRCGYCSNTNSSQSHGMWAHCMKAEDYQDLIDRGWRRSGQYCYKPNNELTCCPSYTIKCNTKNFHLSKSHKKILKKMNNFLRTGKKPENANPKVDSNNTEPDEENGEPSVFMSTDDLLSSNEPKIKIDVDKVLNDIECIRESKIESVNSPASQSANDNFDVLRKSSSIKGPDPTKPLPKKAKLMRMQRKLEKQLKSASSSSVMSTDSIECVISSKKNQKNTEHTLQSLLNTIPNDGKYKLDIKLVQSNAGSTDAALDLYRRYQISVHKDPPEKLTRKSFESFLVRTPLTHETPENGPRCGYGSFHQQYWLNDKLIAVGVIDILPKCISSVYFYYDPEYSFLTLGTYGTLREIQLTQELNAQCESLSDYYMGFYIHSCPKMRYKGKLQPSFLLCPEVYSWHLLNNDILELLDKKKYSRLNPDQNAEDVNKFSPATDLDSLKLLVDFKYALTYKDYREYTGKDCDDSNDNEYENFCEYGRLVGKILSQRLYLVT